MASIQWQDFAIKIGLKRSEGYPIAVLDSPAGETPPGVFFTLPWDEEESTQILFQLRRLSTKYAFFQDFGERLFDALFQGYVKARYDESLGLIAERGVLRLRLIIEAPELAILPWELLYDGERHEFLGLSEQISIIRHLAIGRPQKSLGVEHPLRVLVVMSSPKDLHPIAIERERELIAQTLAPLEAKNVVRTEFLEHATIETLRQKLKETFHVLHFVGHGRFDNRGGCLLLEDTEGWSDELDSLVLGYLLPSSVRLVLLNSCEGARGASGNVDKPTHAGFTGVAQALVEKGVPAVVAMQFKIVEQSARSLVREFYTELTKFQEVDQCISYARKALLSEWGSDYMDWATPVLFLRSKSGKIFQDQPKNVVEEEPTILKLGPKVEIRHPVCGTATFPWSPTASSPLNIEITNASVLIRTFESPDSEGTDND